MPPSEPSRGTRSGLSPTPADCLLAIAIAAVIGLWIHSRTPAGSVDEEHLHSRGSQGGVIVSLAGDRFHAEALIQRDGKLRLLMLGRSATEVIDVESQELVAYVNSGETDLITVRLPADPQPGDGPGRTSQFAAQLPAELVGRPVKVTVAPLRIEERRYRIAFAWPPEPDGSYESHEPAMPVKVQNDAERQLYLEPGGMYTVADIAANGGLTASQRFVGFRAKHDFSPQPGDVLCPVTQTKANPDCSWIIGGRTYAFCCPPCIDEFLERAKQDPAAIKPPEAYVK